MDQEHQSQPVNPNDYNYFLYLESKDIYGTTLGKAKIIELARVFPKIRTLVEVAQVSYLLEVYGEASFVAHEIIVKYLLGETGAHHVIDTMHRMNRVFIGKAHLWILMKFISTYGTSNNSEAELNENGRKAIFEALLAVSDLLGEQSNLVISEVSHEEGLSRRVYEIYVTSYLSRPTHLLKSLIRSRYIFINMHNEYDNRDRPNNYIDIKVEFQEATGIELNYYISLGFMLLALHVDNLINHSVDQSKDYNVIIDPSIILTKATKLNEEIVQRFFSIISQSLETFSGQIENKTDREIAYNFIDMSLKPYVNIRNNLSILTSISNLVNIFTTNVFWIIFDHLRSKGGNDHLNFSSYFGWLFQEYITHLVHEIFGDHEGNLILDMVYRVGKNEKRSPDIIIKTDKLILLFEISATRLQAKRTLAEGDRESLNRDFKKMVFDNLNSLSNFIDDALGGSVPFLLPAELSVKDTIPIVVHIDGIFLSSHVYSYIIQEAQTRGLLLQSKVGQPLFLSATDFETMEDVGANLVEDVLEWATLPNFPNDTLTSFLAAKYGVAREREESNWIKRLQDEMFQEAKDVGFNSHDVI